MFVALRTRVIQTERADFGGILVIIYHIVSNDWLSLVFDASPVDSSEERMRFERVIPSHAQTCLWLQLQELVDQVDQILVLKSGGPLELTAEDLVKNDDFCLATEGGHAACHLVQYNA